jgi:hypothetical protein
LYEQTLNKEGDDFMKRSFVVILTLLTLIIGCSVGGAPYTSATSEITVLDKEYSSDYKNAWIIAYDPNNSTEGESFKVVVKEPMVWNLIVSGSTYFASYHKKGDGMWELKQVAHLGDEDTLR